MCLPPGFWFRWQAGAVDQDVLSADERRRASKIRHAGRRRQFVMGRVAARSLLSEFLGASPATVPLRTAPDGGVDVVGVPLYLSIAHSREHAVAAIGPRAVGVDLERIAPRSPGLARRMLRDDELAVFQALPLEPVCAVILVWTLKEAALKATRTGLRRSLKDLRLKIDVLKQRGRCFFPERDPVELRFAERDGYFLSVAAGMPGRVS